MINLTTKELKVIELIFSSDFMENGNPTDPVWFFSVAEYYEGDISGVVSSLSKKGLVYTQEENTRDHIIWLTDLGLQTIKDQGLLVAELKSILN
jgi:hypothetical protein